MRTMFLTVAVALSVPAATAAEPPKYLDDRSDPAALVRSFYNAINRHEFARAWDYFGETKPSTDYETFAKGYEKTEHVDVVTGAVSQEGAAGSTFFSIPVSIAAFGTDGSESVFSGCYTAKLTNPQLQDPPFTGLRIEGAEMQASEQPYEEKLPEKCGDGPPAPAKDAVLEKATTIFATAHAGHCDAIKPDGTTGAPEIYPISYRYATTPEADPDSHARLFRFFCGMGAYNESHVYYLDKGAEGLREVEFASPELDIHYVGNDSEGKVEAINIVGYTTESEMINSFYDDATKSITSHVKWRGIGDASSSGTWLFRNGAFTLVSYSVDPTYDEEINPETVLDYNSAP